METLPEPTPVRPKHKCSRTKFTPEEDRKLKQLVRKYGEKNWSEISKIMVTRTGRQCRDRYCNYLKKGLTSKEWSPEEDQYILNLVNKIGFHWVEISKNLKGRSSNSVKNRWHMFLSKYQNPPIPKEKPPTVCPTIVKNDVTKSEVIFKDPFGAENVFNESDCDLFPVNDFDL